MAFNIYVVSHSAPERFRTPVRTGLCNPPRIFPLHFSPPFLSFFFFLENYARLFRFWRAFRELNERFHAFKGGSKLATESFSKPRLGFFFLHARKIISDVRGKGTEGAQTRSWGKECFRKSMLSFFIAILGIFFPSSCCCLILESKAFYESAAINPLYGLLIMVLFIEGNMHCGQPTPTVGIVVYFHDFPCDYISCVSF